MFFVYILKSDKDNNLYLGCANDLRKRLKEHNSGLVSSTKYRSPLRLVYYEAYRSKKDAFHREHNLKLRGQALTQLKQRISLSIEA